MENENCTRILVEKSSRESFEVLTAVVINSSVVWAVTPCSPLKVNRSFGVKIASIFKVGE
jgi:hypothetical protein